MSEYLEIPATANYILGCMSPSKKLTVVGYLGKKRGEHLWECECECGNKVTVVAGAFLRGRYKQCRECRTPTKKPDAYACNKCKKVLPFTEEYFWKSSQHNFGLRKVCRNCVLETVRPDARDYARRVRVEVLTHYSGGKPKCACCGEDGFERLCIDHINGGGRKHIYTPGRSTHIHTRLKSDGFPEGFQVLCHNCNECKRIYGYCIHKPPAGIVEHFPLYTKAWNLNPVPGGHPCIHCKRTLPRREEFFSPHSKMGDGLINCCRDCERHLRTEDVRNKAIRNKKSVFLHYSNGDPKCACCGTGVFEFLSVDHIEGGGQRHRKEIKMRIVDWLIKQNYPPGFQILCYSCNMAKGFYGKCVHN